MGMDLGMAVLKDKDKDKDRYKGKGMDHRQDQDKDRDKGARIESCPSLLRLIKRGNLRKLLCICQSISQTCSS